MAADKGLSSTQFRQSITMGLFQKIKDEITLLFPASPEALRNALLRLKGKSCWQIGESGTFISIPEDYCDGKIYATRHPAKVIEVSSQQILIQTENHQYLCHCDGRCKDDFGLLIQ